MMNRSFRKSFDLDRKVSIMFIDNLTSLISAFDVKRNKGGWGVEEEKQPKILGRVHGVHSRGSTL